VRSHLLALGRQSLVYGLSGAAIQLVGLVTLPVYTRHFSPAEYGVIELATVAFAALIIAVDAGLGAALQRDYFEAPENDARGRLVIASTATIFSTSLATALAIPLIALREPIAGWLFDDRSQGDVITLVALSVVVGTLAIFLREVMRLRFRPWLFAASALLAAGVAGAVGVAWVVAFDGDVTAVVAAILAGQLCAALFGLVAVRGYVGLRFSRARLVSLMRFGLPLVPAGAALWGIGFIDRVILARLDGLASVGEYAVGTRFASVLMFVVGAFGTAYVPFMFSMHASEPERERALRAGILTYASVVFVGVALLLALFAREIAHVVAPGFDDAYRIVGILSLGVAAFGLTPITGAGIGIARRTGYALRYTVVALIASVALCFALIPPIGLVGAAIGTAAAYFALTLLYLRRSQILHPVDFHLGRVVRIFLLGALLVPVGFVDTGTLALTLALKALAALAFAAALWPLGVMGELESAELRGALRRLRTTGAAR